MESPEHSALHRAATALWMATLSLMTAFMQTSAPAHRYLLARRISANFVMLSGQPCFSTSSRGSFTRLGNRWASKADGLKPRTGYTGGDFGLPAH